MVTKRNTDASVSATFSYPSANTAIYAIAHGATKSEISEFLSTRLAHLYALIAMTNGDAGEAFRCYNDTIQDEFMESCGLLAKECVELFAQLQAKVAA